MSIVVTNETYIFNRAALHGVGGRNLTTSVFVRAAGIMGAEHVAIPTVRLVHQVSWKIISIFYRLMQHATRQNGFYLSALVFDF